MLNKGTILNWYDKYSGMIFQYIFSIVRDAYQAEDLTQDTFIRAYDYLSSNKNVTYPKTFLYRTAHNLAIDYLRKQKPVQKLNDFFTNQADSKLSIESIVEIKEESSEIYKALAQLKTSFRQVIILRKIKRFSIQETAQILGWSESKVKSTLHRATKKLEKNLVEGGFISELS